MKQLAAVFFLLSAAAPALAQDELVGARVRAWYARMSGVVEAEDNNTGSTTLDLSDDLGLGNQNWTPELEAYLKIPVVGKIYLGWWHAQDSGSEILTRDIEFGGSTFPVSTQVDSDFELDVVYLMYEFCFPTIPLGDLLQLEFGVSAGVRMFRGHGMIEGGGLDANETGTAGLPTLGVHATLRLFDLVRVEAELVGLVFSYSNAEVHYFEGFCEATVQPLPWIYAGLGYKRASLNFQQEGTDRFRANIDIAGFYLTVGFHF
jgi:hypothetical protein